MDFTGFANSFSEGEIAEDAWDRVDIQPVTKGVEEAVNALIMVSGPLRKRRGFFRVGAVNNAAQTGRLVPFRRSIADAQMLEFGNLTARVWQVNGAPLLSGGVQVQFATPYTSAQLAGLRWKQVGDVIYFRNADGTAPQALARANGGVAPANWTFAAVGLTNGPWLAENADLTSTVTLTNTGGPADILDGNDTTGAGAIPAGATVSIAASQAIFSAAMVGQELRIRANGQSVSCLGWSPGFKYFTNDFVTSVGNMYQATNAAGTGTTSGNNPPVQTQGSQSDGAIVWGFVHDGAGIVQITGYTSPTAVTGTVVHTCPVKTGQATSFFAFNAFSADQGWPTAWPEVREERLAEGGTASAPDFVSLTSTAGFTPTTEDFTPGTGLGVITDVNAIRRRVGVDGAQILWFCVANYLLCGTEESEHMIAGSVLDEPLTPLGGVTIKDLTVFGSDPVAPVKVWNGLVFVQRGGQTVRWMAIDTQQGASFDDYSVLASHIGQRGFAQLAWQPTPDQALFARLADGGFAAMTYHKEQNVRGWTRQQLPGGVITLGQAPAPNGWIVEDIAMLPGLGRLETLWMIVSRTKAGATQRIIWQQAQPADGLYMDGALAYSGAPATVFGGLTDYVGETVRVLADGAQIDGLVVNGAGEVTLPAAASNVYIGLAYQVTIKSLQLAVGLSGGTLGQRQRIAAAIVSFRGAQVSFGLANGGPLERVSVRQKPDVPTVATKRWRREVTLAGDGDEDGRDPRILVVEDSAYDFILYSIKPKVVPGG
jgi:hypothetical protein